MSRLPQAFTIGHQPSYDRYLAEATPEDPAMKKGRDGDYGGGIVWKTQVEAEAFIDRGVIVIEGVVRDPTTFAVYGLLLPNGWAQDVSPSPSADGGHRLLVDANILALPRGRPMFDDLTEDGLLDALDAERSKFTSMDRERYIHMIDALVSRGVYPTDTVEGNPNTVHAMVSGWGARWHVWKAPLACRHCGTDLRDSVTGPPFKREIAQYDRLADCTVGIECPDCKKNI